MYMVQVARELL